MPSRKTAPTAGPKRPKPTAGTRRTAPELARKVAKKTAKNATRNATRKTATKTAKKAAERPKSKRAADSDRLVAADSGTSTGTYGAKSLSHRAVCKEGDFRGHSRATRALAEMDGMAHQNTVGNESHEYTVIATQSMAKSLADTGAKATRGVQTIVYVHGIGNKPMETVLRCQWDHALVGFGLGERSRMAYWRQADRHGPPKPDTCAASDATEFSPVMAMLPGAESFGSKASMVAMAEKIGHTDEERAVLREIAAEMAAAKHTKLPNGRYSAEGLEDLPIPGFVLRLYTELFLKDARDFLFDDTRREVMCRTLRDRLDADSGPFAVIGHSQGSMIAWLVLHQLGATKFQVPLLVTIGSPLSIAAVRRRLCEMIGVSPTGKLPAPTCVNEWQNVYDPRDLVSLGSGIADDVGSTGSGAAVMDFRILNPDRARDAHSSTGYLGHPVVRNAVRSHLDTARFQQVAGFVMAADVTRDFEGRPAEERRPLLIELTDASWAAAEQARRATETGARPRDTRETTILPTVASMVDELRQKVESLVPEKVDRALVDFRVMKRYVSVRLTRSEAERLAAMYANPAERLTIPPLYRIWRNAKKIALLETSVHTVQASAAHRSYDAAGQGIHWAVLDSGCTPHPHFDTHGSIVAAYDCTQATDEPVQVDLAADDTGGATRDRYGHGTHVAGIIAGSYAVPGGGTSPRTITGIAPRTKLHIYKVLNDQGVGDDAWIIKALDHIAPVNESATTPRIAGVNLSLGGPFEQDVFGCGHTPLCEELRRLWGKGVMVVLAAGNEGFARLMSDDGEVGINLSFSIGDPANLEEAIAVGSVHKIKPHLYGVSHYSSRGPTADGRAKPDCVAPGEKILSCRNDFAPNTTAVRDLYMELSGTSMAAPHVSGVIAAFLSRRTEFIGYPDRVKRILLESCTSIGRERDLQGAGIPNLIRMLVGT